MIAHIAGLPVEELTTLALGGSAGWALLSLFGWVGAVAERVADRREEGRGGETGSFTPETPGVDSGVT